MKKCVFCNLDFSKVENTIIEETEDFLVLPTVGAITEGYVLIIPKEHVNSMCELKEHNKLNCLIEKYREIFKKVFGKYPIVFEHGTGRLDSNSSSSSVTHAHIHVVDHNYKDERKIIKELNLKEVSEEEFFKNKGKSYISYISPNGVRYITHNFSAVSQQMRIYIADDLQLKEEYNWRKFCFNENIEKTIKKLKG